MSTMAIFGSHWRLLQLALLLASTARASLTDGSFGYVTTTDVSRLLNLSYDIRDMRVSTDLSQKRNIFDNGRNALPLTLAGLSSNSSQYSEFPLYNVYRYAFHELGMKEEGDETGYFDGSPIEEYGNTLVNDLFSLNRTRIQGDAALVMNVVMSYWGTFYKMLQVCEANGDASQMIAFLDQAAALYIGEGQPRGNNVQGFMLYNLGERSGTNFDQDGSSGEALINKLVLETFVGIKQDIDNGICKTGVDGYKEVRAKVKSLIKSTNIVLVQMFLHHLEVTADSDFTELYSLAILPQIAACDTYAYETLMKLTVQNSVTADSRAEIKTTLQKAYSCLHVLCSDIGEYQSGRIPECTDHKITALASYAPSTDVDRKAYIDRDLRHIRMFMRLEAYNAVRDYYNYGWNTDFSIKELATNNFSLVTSVEYERFKLYFPDENFAENLIMNVLDLQSPFDAMSVEDRVNVVAGVLEGIVMYFSVASEFESAISVCENPSSSEESALSYWDGGAAFYIGSMEGETESLADTGSLLFGLAISLCDNFNVCVPMDSAVNEALLNYFEFGRNTLAVGACQDALSIIQQNIKPYLMIPLIQATLYHTAAATDGAMEGSTGALYAYSRAILPTINRASTTAAATIESNSDVLVTPNVSAVFDAVRAALTTMDTDCRRIGKLNMAGGSYGVCEDDPTVGQPDTVDTSAPTPSSEATEPPVVVPPTDPKGIAWGRYNFLNQRIAEGDSQFSMDIRDIATADSVEAAAAIYSSASKYATNGLYGGIGVESLADFSRKAAELMADDPLYNFYLVAFYDDEDFDKPAQEQDFAFADTVVELALNPDKGNSPQLAADTSIVMNSYMMIAHRLYESVRSCTKQLNATDMIDSAVALWIGQEQGEGSFNSGWMLYAQAQHAFRSYGNNEKEAPINSELMQLFNDAQELAVDCGSINSTSVLLTKKVDEIVRSISKILLQLLLASISDNNRNHVELYALSFIPQATGCDMGTYENLRDALFLDFDRSMLINNDVILRFGKVLSCLRITCADLGDTSNSRPELQNMVAAICSQIERFQGASMIAGYATDTDVSELSRIDLDVTQIDVFMRTKSYKLAYDYYVNGRNSLNADGTPITLQSLSAGDRSDAGDWFNSYVNYFQTANYTNSLILSAMTTWQSDNGIFASASRRQLSEAVTRSFQTSVTSMQIATKLRSSITLCKSSQNDITLVDQAAALFAGSIEGPDPGGDPDGSGKLMFALSKDMCRTFGKCEEGTDSAVNDFVLVSLRDMKRAMVSNNCDAAEEILQDLLATMQVPLIQGTLLFAALNEKLPAQSMNMTLSSGSILADSILPFVNSANQTSAAIVQSNMEFHLDGKPVIDGVEYVLNAFLGAYDAMNISCNVIGVPASTGLSACGTSATEPKRDTPTDLGEDLYTTSTYVKDKANIALDIQAMQDALVVGREALAKIIYDEGENSPIFDAQGVAVDLRSFASFSTNASTTMRNNPLYQVTVYALRDSQGLYMGEQAGQYANTIVQEALTDGAPLKSPVAAEAAVVLNLWMELANDLYLTVASCKNRMFTDDEAVHSVDGAVAYWIGDGELADPDNTKKGHLFYALAEELGGYFNTMQGKQSTVNTNILRLFHQAKFELSLPSACAEDATIKRLLHIVNKIIAQMLVVNAQGLIHNLRVGDRARIRVYAHAYVPLVAACSPTQFEFLRSKLLDYSHSEVEVDLLVDAIRKTFPCFNIACNEVGLHKTETSVSCAKSEETFAIAGYKAATDITNFAKIDLDIQELDILMRMEAYEAAEQLYEYGKHVELETSSDRTALSLQSLATSMDRSRVPQFESFKRYNQGDSSYADTVVRFAFMANNGLEAEERRTLLTGIASFMVLYMGALMGVQEAVEACIDGNSEKAGAAWDKAASWIIGSMEGTSEAGSTEGRLLWALSKQQCEEFDTCSHQVRGSSEFNDMIVLQLFTGRGAALTESCNDLQESASRVAFLLPVPLIQGAISTALLLQKTSGARQQQLLAQAYVYSQAVLPLIHDVDEEAANTIADSFDLISGKALPQGAAVVIAAYSSVLSGMGIDCSAIGSNDMVDTCTGTVKKGGLVAGLVLSALAMIISAYFLWRYYRSRNAEKEENNPIFIPKDGEFNHASEFARHSSSQSDASGDDDSESDDASDNLDNIGSLDLKEDEYALPKEMMGSDIQIV
ncbi:hypothetical protein MPSEU_000132000 [Mayamaea pseudoterrestris]|nr:hypothetical protein MPSEU_000132000 [Mayamaea pseudoterrestris]